MQLGIIIMNTKITGAFGNEAFISSQNSLNYQINRFLCNQTVNIVLFNHSTNTKIPNICFAHYDDLCQKTANRNVNFTSKSKDRMHIYNLANSISVKIFKYLQNHLLDAYISISTIRIFDIVNVNSIQNSDR